MGSASCPSDNDAQATTLRFPREISRCIRSAMGRKDAMLAGDAKLVQRIDALAHRFPIRLAAHDYSDEWL
jgi:hypothetical protein